MNRSYSVYWTERLPTGEPRPGTPRFGKWARDAGDAIAKAQEMARADQVSGTLRCDLRAAWLDRTCPDAIVTLWRPSYAIVIPGEAVFLGDMDSSLQVSRPEDHYARLYTEAEGRQRIEMLNLEFGAEISGKAQLFFIPKADGSEPWASRAELEAAGLGDLVQAMPAPPAAQTPTVAPAVEEPDPGPAFI